MMNRVKISRYRLGLSVFAAVLLTVLPALAPANAAAGLVFSEAQNSKSVVIKANTLATITLHSTYWHYDSSTNLTLIGAEVAKPTMPGPKAPAGCQHPGSGCGTMSWVIKAGKAGKAVFVATRDTCGEALRCTGNQGKYVLFLNIK
jgi:hypothetical protein